MVTETLEVDSFTNQCVGDRITLNGAAPYINVNDDNDATSFKIAAGTDACLCTFRFKPTTKKISSQSSVFLKARCRTTGASFATCTVVFRDPDNDVNIYNTTAGLGTASAVYATASIGNYAANVPKAWLEKGVKVYFSGGAPNDGYLTYLWLEVVYVGMGAGFSGALSPLKLPIFSLPHGHDEHFSLKKRGVFALKDGVH